MSTTPTEILETTAAAIEATIAAAESAVSETASGLEAMLDIDSIKSMMDGFEPAALLPDLGELFGSLSTVCRFAVMIGPVVLLILGLAYLFLSPKEANYYFGYRCYFGMGSVNAWRFTQRLAGIVFGGVGLILTIVMFTASGSFATMEVTDMVWKAVNCLIWEAILALLATLTVNGSAALRFDRKGEYRKKTRRQA